MGELDLQFELVFRDGKFAHRAGSSDRITAPHPIRCARGQLPILDGVSCFVAQQRFVRHRPVSVRTAPPMRIAGAVCITGGESGQIPEDTTAAPSTLTILWEAIKEYRAPARGAGKGPGEGNCE
jgi:hypothetical protein